MDLQPTLTGNLLELRPLQPADYASLFAVASDPLIWEQHPDRDRYQAAVFKTFFREATSAGDETVVVARAWCSR